MTVAPSFTRYCKSYNLGHRQLRRFFEEPVSVEEKIDGSQISFCLWEGEILIRSRGRVFDINAPDGMFEIAVEQILKRRELLIEGLTYRGEYVRKPRHNVLTYNRVPKGNIIIFDVAFNNLDHYTYETMAEFANKADFECVKQFHSSIVYTHHDQVNELLNLESQLGGPTIEGVVFKRRLDPIFNDRDLLVMAKLVSPEFKESQKSNPGGDKTHHKTVTEMLVNKYKNERNWEKVVQHCRENGLLNDEPADLKHLMAELKDDLVETHAEQIKETLYKHFIKVVQRGVSRGFPEWYKAKLVEKQFETSKD